MKRCPACGQDNPSMFTHCEWCGRSIVAVPDLETIEKRSSKKSNRKKDKSKDKGNSIGSKVITVAAGIAVAIVILCYFYLTSIFSFNMKYTIIVSCLIGVVYLLNALPIFIAKKRPVSNGVKALLTFISLMVAAGSVVLGCLGIINS